VRFDLARREVLGGPVSVIEQVARASATTQSGVVHAAISPTGTLVYLPGDVGIAATGPKQLVLASIDGRTIALGFPPQWYIHPRFSPDGKQIAVATDEGRDANIWIADLASGASLRRLTFGGRNLFPIWTPDGRYVTFQSDRDGDRAIYRQLADGSGVPERLTKPEEAAEHQPESWRPDGRVLSLNKVFQGDQGIWTIGSGADAKPEVFIDTRDTVEKHSAFSPDGRWIAYMANTDVANTHAEVFVQPFPPTRAKYQISFSGGRTPVWSSDGRRLFYHEPSTNRLFFVTVQTSPTFAVTRPAEIAIRGTVHPLAQRNYDVTPDGKQLLVVVSASDGQEDPSRSRQQINIVLNWFEELKARVPVSK
jgi:Tol biopolymer transport system component